MKSLQPQRIAVTLQREIDRFQVDADQQGHLPRERAVQLVEELHLKPEPKPEAVSWKEKTLWDRGRQALRCLEPALGAAEGKR